MQHHLSNTFCPGWCDDATFLTVINALLNSQNTKVSLNVNYDSKLCHADTWSARVCQSTSYTRVLSLYSASLWPSICQSNVIALIFLDPLESAMPPAMKTLTLTIMVTRLSTSAVIRIDKLQGLTSDRGNRRLVWNRRPRRPWEQCTLYTHLRDPGETY